MKTNKINEEIEKTLNSTEFFKKYEGNPFLFSRIEAQLNRIDGSSYTNMVKKFILQLQPIMIILILAFNIWTATIFLSDHNDTTSMRDDELNNLIEEYALSTNNYDLSILYEQNTYNHE